MPRRSAVLLAAALLLAGCERGGARTLLIGAAGPWKHDYAAMARRGITLAIDDANRDGGVGGARLAVLAKDDGGAGGRAAAVAQEFATDGRVLAVVGHLNSAAMVSASRVYDAQLAAVSPTATTPDLTGISPWVFRVSASDSASGSALAGFAAGLGARRVVVLYENNAYGRGLADAFRRDFRGEFLGFDPIADSGGDVEPLVAYYKTLAPDLVVVAGTRDSGLEVLREARRQRFATTFLGGDGWAQIAGDSAAAEGVYVAAPSALTSSDPRVRRFIAAFTRRFGAPPDVSAALAYDATTAIVAALRAGGASRERVRDALSAGAAPDGGLTGSLRFDAGGDPVSTAVALMRVRRGAMVPVR